MGNTRAVPFYAFFVFLVWCQTWSCSSVSCSCGEAWSPQLVGSIVVERQLDLSSLAARLRGVYWQHSPSRRAGAMPSSLFVVCICLWGVEQRSVHSRNKKAMELVAKGWSALQEVDRVIDYTERRDSHLIPLLRTAKENFELALEVDNMNTHARYWLSRLHFKYHVPGACKAVGAALLIEAANMGDADAQYELGCHLRVEV
ncbi:hypothetical protein Taro_015317 [Colocasia esculenta]|uniref:Uncharacterized protein n=1 Tax=Colocasia esculenta TaxID=4460 RepID=A0A843UKZ9_COLES|nr:hypothetical protein [Colocasia esculenta]